MNPDKLKLLILLVASLFAVTGFCISFLYYESVYALNQRIVHSLQHTFTSTAFKTFMNIVSNIFNPTVCAGYILILYVMTARKLEVIAFLLWFLFLSWTISILKQLFQQPRPFWVDPKIQMLEWTCYTEYGNPSGHSALVIVLLDFFVRFGCKWRESVKKYQTLWYTLVIIMQITVMFSRMYLGMHSLNQVLFGLMLGAYSLIPYYLYIQKTLFTFCIKFLTEGRKVINVISMLIFMLLLALQQLFLTYIPRYAPSNDPRNQWIATILSHPSCSSYRYQTSFYFRCFEDSSIAFGIPAMMISLSVTHNGYSLLKKLSYPRLSWKFMAYLLTTITVAMIPVAIFLNPKWKKVNVKEQALMLWFLHIMGFVFGIFSLVVVSSYLLTYFGLDHYQFQSYYNEYKIITEEGGKKEIELVNVEIPKNEPDDVR